MIINVHVIRNYSANVVNRGEDGEPKSLVFGGKKRNRISSQARKHKWRASDLFKESFHDGLMGVRTRKVGVVVRDELLKEGYSERVALRAGIDATLFVGTKKKPKDIKMDEDALVADTIRAYSQRDIDKIVTFVKEYLSKEEMSKAIADVEVGKNVKAFINFDDLKIDWLVPVDTTLFGRMVASDPALNVPASVYVAHAFTTHEAAEDVDFFTATDDLTGAFEETGAAHMGNISFDTACMYEYAYIDTDILSANLKDVEGKEEIIRKAIGALIPTMVLETPDGKQTTMASRPAPSAVLVEIQGNKVVFDYANAYADVVWESPMVENSVKRLKAECIKSNGMYGSYRNVTKRIWLSPIDDTPFEEATVVNTLVDMVNEILMSL